MEFSKVELAAVISVSKGPDASQIILIDSTLTKDLECSLTANETSALGIPGSENLVVLFLFSLGERPRDLGCRSYTSRLIMLLEGLLQR
jgi:hypothetical protein